MTRTKKDERAFEALLVSSARKIDADEIDINSIPAPSGKEQQVLEILGTDFIERVLDGSKSTVGGPVNEDDFDKLALTGIVDGLALLRADEVDEETAAELEANDNELIDRKKREQEEQTD